MNRRIYPRLMEYKDLSFTKMLTMSFLGVVVFSQTSNRISKTWVRLSWQLKSNLTRDNELIMMHHSRPLNNLFSLTIMHPYSPFSLEVHNMIDKNNSTTCREGGPIRRIDTIHSFNLRALHSGIKSN